MKQRTLTLTEAERAELERTRDRDPRPYLRERAAALLKIAEGIAPFAVARSGLLKPRHPETLYLWLNQYERRRVLCPRPACRGKRGPRVSPPGTAGDARAVAPEPGEPRASRARAQSLDPIPA